jgi:hypothetical protein
MVVFGLAVAALAIAAPASTSAAQNPQPVGIEPLGSTEWPAVAAQLAKNIARDAFAHDYDGVWNYLLPAYQKAVPQSRWERCQHAHPTAPPSVTITKVQVASAEELAFDLPLVGRQNVQEIQLVVQYKSAGLKGNRYAVLYTYWLKQGKIWRAVWPSEEFRAYAGGGCYVAPQGSTLY